MKKLFQITLLIVLCTYLTGCEKKTEANALLDSTSTIPSTIIPTETASPTTEMLSSLPPDRLSSLNGEYDTLLALSTEDYQEKSLQDFNATVKAKIDGDADILNSFNNLMNDITPSDDAYSFVCETLNRSISEIISPQLGDVIAISQYLKRNEGIYNENDGEVFYSFMFTALYSVEYRIIDAANISVGERDKLIMTYHINFQEAVDKMDREQLKAANIQSELQAIANNLATELSTNILVFENAIIHSIELLDEGKDYRVKQ